MPTLEQEFTARLRSAITQARDLGYNPSRFEQMLDAMDAVSLAKKMVESGDLQDGLRKIHSLNRLDLSMEQIMLEPQFAPLFSPEHLAAAQWRLNQL